MHSQCLSTEINFNRKTCRFFVGHTKKHMHPWHVAVCHPWHVAIAADAVLKGATCISLTFPVGARSANAGSPSDRTAAAATGACAACWQSELTPALPAPLLQTLRTESVSG